MISPQSSNANNSKSNPSIQAGFLSVRVLRVVFVAMFFMVVLYALVGTFFGINLPRPAEELQQIYRIISFVGGICVAGLLLIRNLISRTLSSSDEEAEAAEAAIATPARLLKIRKLTLIAFVVSETIAVLGLIFVLMGGQRRTLYIFCAISLACLILFFPRDNN